MADLTTTVQSIYEKFDEDKDGNLSPVELRNFYDGLSASRGDLNLTADGFDAWFAAIDVNGNGSVAPDELKNYLTSINYTAWPLSLAPNETSEHGSRTYCMGRVNLIILRPLEVDISHNLI